MSERRFPGRPAHLSYDEFVSAFAEFVDGFLDKGNIHIVFVPHIYSDLGAIADVLSEMDIWYRRDRVTTAPYLTGPNSERYIFDLYDSVDLSLGMRLHANVCPIGLETPCIGLSNGHPKVGDLYRNLGLFDRIVPVHEPDFASALEETVTTTIDAPDEVSQAYRKTVDTLRPTVDGFHERIESLVDRHR